MGVFLQPKDTSRIDGDSTKLTARSIGVAQGVDDEFIPVDGTFDSSIHGQSGSVLLRDAVRRNAEPGAPLPSGGKPAGVSSPGVRGWRGPISRNVPSGFGRGTRAGNTGVRGGR